MKIKTSELTGAALDWAVAVAQGWRLIDGEWRSSEPAFEGDSLGKLVAGSAYSPSTSWAQGGPLIESHAVSVECTDDQLPRSAWRWQATIAEKSYALGQSPLIAAMRAIVLFKMGETVDVPDDLAGGAPCT